MEDPTFFSEEQRQAIAADLQAWMAAYAEAGFSREEAIQMICRPNIVIQNPGAQMPPEQAELYERMNAILARQLAEED